MPRNRQPECQASQHKVFSLSDGTQVVLAWQDDGYIVVWPVSGWAARDVVTYLDRVTDGVASTRGMWACTLRPDLPTCHHEEDMVCTSTQWDCGAVDDFSRLGRYVVYGEDDWGRLMNDLNLWRELPFVTMSFDLPYTLGFEITVYPPGSGKTNMSVLIGWPEKRQILTMLMKEFGTEAVKAVADTLGIWLDEMLTCHDRDACA